MVPNPYRRDKANVKTANFLFVSTALAISRSCDGPVTRRNSANPLLLKAATPAEPLRQDNRFTERSSPDPEKRWPGLRI